jgi:gluconokinase
MTPKLSPLAQQLVEKLFELGDQAEASRRLIEQCGNNLPFCNDHDEFKMERIRFAVLRIGLGDLNDLQKAIDDAKRDWRDVLVWGGFGERLDAHQEWAERTLNGDAIPLVIIIMGMSGAGKTTIGSLLARTLGWMYYETDNFLSTENFNKFIRGEPLRDEVVEEWLEKIRILISKYVAKKQNVIFACSALKESYRQALQTSAEVNFVYLSGSYALIEGRQKKRKSSLPNVERLAYQFSIFEEPHNVFTVDISQTPKEIVGLLQANFKI